MSVSEGSVPSPGKGKVHQQQQQQQQQNSPGKTHSSTATLLPASELELLQKYWRAACYLSVGQIYLQDNPLLLSPLQPEHVKQRLLGHWGTCPGLNLIWTMLNRVIRQRDSDVLFVCGPGHGGPAVVANAYLEGSYSTQFPEVTQDEQGMHRLCKQFSFPGGIPSHCGATTPGSIHEGGELGYSMSHAFGAAFDNPNLIVACVVGDGEAETGPLAASWHSNKFLNPARDGAVIPILHLNGFKIASPAFMARLPHNELESLLRGFGYEPIFCERGGHTEDAEIFSKLAHSLDVCFDRIAAIQRLARSPAQQHDGFGQGDGDEAIRQVWPMIVLRTSKGWSGPEEVDGDKTEGTWRSHQVPLANVREDPAHLKQLEAWLLSYRPRELFDERGALVPALQELAPKGDKRMSSSPYANPGVIKMLEMPPLSKYALTLPEGPGSLIAEAPRPLGCWLRDIIVQNPTNFRLFGPDETQSNRLGAVFEKTGRMYLGHIKPLDKGANLSCNGRVLEILSEHTIQGWLEGYVLTGRFGMFSTYESFMGIVDSMLNQHVKWVMASKEVKWRKAIPSVNIFLTSHVWRQDHNGASHQDPTCIEQLLNKKACVRVLFPPDGNSLLVASRRCLSSTNFVNLVVCGKNPEIQWLDLAAAEIHVKRGIGLWTWACNDVGSEPDVVIASAGDVPTIEALACIDILRQHVPGLKMRMVNVVDLATLSSGKEESLTNAEFDAYFTRTRPVVFAFHSTPGLIHRLVYRRNGHSHWHVRGFIDEGTTTTPFDMLVLNQLDRFSLAMMVLDRVPRLSNVSAHLRQRLQVMLSEHKSYIHEQGQDLPEVLNWRWGSGHPLIAGGVAFGRAPHEWPSWSHAKSQGQGQGQSHGQGQPHALGHAQGHFQGHGQEQGHGHPNKHGLVHDRIEHFSHLSMSSSSTDSAGSGPHAAQVSHPSMPTAVPISSSSGLRPSHPHS